MKKCVAEFIGTFTLVLIGCGTAVVAGDKAGFLGIALAFGLALATMAYGIGPISGCHINPAVSIGVFTAGRMSFAELIGYIISQCAGAIAASAVLLAIVSGLSGGYDVAAKGLGQNGWGPGYQGGYQMSSAAIFEFVATLLFIIVILGSTQKEASTPVAGLAIGLSLAMAIIFGLNITGGSLNPARSLGPALLAGGKALTQLWLFLIVPSLAGIIAGLLFKSKLLEK